MYLYIPRFLRYDRPGHGFGWQREQQYVDFEAAQQSLPLPSQLGPPPSSQTSLALGISHCPNVPAQSLATRKLRLRTVASTFLQSVPTRASA